MISQGRVELLLLKCHAIFQLRVLSLKNVVRYRGEMVNRQYTFRMCLHGWSRHSSGFKSEETMSSPNFLLMTLYKI